MKANLRLDPQAGPGYGILEIYGAGIDIEPEIIISRLSDKKTFSDGGWENGVHAFSPERWDITDECLRIWLGPAFIDDIDPNDHYELKLPGIGQCIIGFESLNQSQIIDANGVGAYAPPPQSVSNGAWQLPQDNIIYEGVEQTPQNLPDEEPLSVSGVAGDLSANVAPPKKNRGCIIISILLTIIWLGGGWVLWHGAMNAPVANEEESTPFEIMPKSQDSSVVEENPENDTTRSP